MKKIAVVVSAIVILVSLTVLVFAENPAKKEFNDMVYRGKEWEFDFGVPKNETLVILPQDREQPKVYGNGYVGRVKNQNPKYNIILLED